MIGVLPFVEEIKRVERSSARFVTAEEEARIRKSELSNMAVRPAAIAAVTGNPEETVGDGKENTTLSTDSNVEASNVDNTAALNSEAVEPASTARRPSNSNVLSSTNSSLIATLNNMLSGKAASVAPPSPMRRNSSITLAAPKEGLDLKSDSTSTPNKPVSKSKILQVYRRAFHDIYYNQEYLLRVCHIFAEIN